MAANTPFFQAFGALLFGRRPRMVALDPKRQCRGSAPPEPERLLPGARKARQATLRLIHGHLAWSLERRVQSAQLWLGRRVKIVDGTTLSMPDTAANQQRWPQASSQGEGLGFPCMKPFRQAPRP